MANRSNDSRTKRAWLSWTAKWLLLVVPSIVETGKEKVNNKAGSIENEYTERKQSIRKGSRRSNSRFRL